MLAVQLFATSGANAIGVVSDEESAILSCSSAPSGVINRNEFNCWGELPKVGTPEYEAWFKEARKFGRRFGKSPARATMSTSSSSTRAATFPVSVLVVKRGGMVVICAGTTGYNLTLDARYLWMHQKRVQGSHFANLMQAAQANKLVVERRIDPACPKSFPGTNSQGAHRCGRTSTPRQHGGAPAEVPRAGLRATRSARHRGGGDAVAAQAAAGFAALDRRSLIIAAICRVAWTTRTRRLMSSKESEERRSTKQAFTKDEVAVAMPSNETMTFSCRASASTRRA